MQFRNELTRKSIPFIWLKTNLMFNSALIHLSLWETLISLSGSRSPQALNFGWIMYSKFGLGSRQRMELHQTIPISACPWQPRCKWSLTLALHSCIYLLVRKISIWMINPYKSFRLWGHDNQGDPEKQIFLEPRGLLHCRLWLKPLLIRVLSD